MHFHARRNPAMHASVSFTSTLNFGTGTYKCMIAESCTKEVVGMLQAHACTKARQKGEWAHPQNLLASQHKCRWMIANDSSSKKTCRGTK